MTSWSSSCTVKGEGRKVGYASKKLSLAEAKYPIIEKECLAVVWVIRRFKLYLAARDSHSKPITNP